MEIWDLYDENRQLTGHTHIRGEVDLSRATTDEVTQVVWMDRAGIRRLFDEGELVETLGYFFTEM